MNKSNKIFISSVSLLFVFLGFNQTAKAEENLLYLGTDNVYYKCQGKPITPQTDDTNGDNKITSVDLASVKILNNTFFTDKNNVYYVSTFNYYCYFYKLVSADSATFKVLNDLYEKDKNSVYYNSFYHGGPGIDKIQNVDATTFEIFKEDGEYGMDKNNIFSQGKLLDSQNQAITNTSLYDSIKGKIILKTESNGEAYYVSPNKKEMYSLSRPVIAFRVMREQGIGINNANLEKIPVGGNCPNYNSNCNISNRYDLNFAKNQKGKIFIQVEKNGEAWYINPKDAKRYFLGRPTDAFNIMKTLGLGISNTNFNNLIKTNNITNLETYKNTAYGFEISLPASWKAYSEYDGKVFATSPSKFPSNPLILTGTPPTLDFQIEVIENNTITSYANSFLKNAVKTGLKYIVDRRVIYLAQSGKNVIQVYSSNSNYDQNDNIFDSLKFNK